MSEFAPIFKEILANIKDLKKRIARFETWEPNGGTTVGCHAHKTTAQTTTAGVWTTVTYDNELWDSSSIHSAGVFTIPKTGRYLFNTFLPFTTYAGIIYVRYEPNIATANYTMQVNADANYSPICMTGIFELTAGTEVVLQVNRIGSGAVIGFNTTFPYYSYTQVQLMGLT